jgi:hypothetical protein
MSELILKYHGIRNALIFVGILAALATLVLFLK